MMKAIIRFGVLLAPLSALAAITTVEDLSRTINRIATFMSSLIVSISIVIILYAAFQYVTAAGDETKVEDAKKTVIYAIVGLVVALFAYYVPGIVQQVLQI